DGHSNPGTWTLIGTVAAGATNFTDTTGTTNATYWYRVRAHNTCNDSAESNWLVVTVSPPGTPFYLSASPFANRAILNWYEDSAAGVVGYKIERAPDDDGIPGTWASLATIDATDIYGGSFTDSGLVLDTTYWYRVRAFNGLGE